MNTISAAEILFNEDTSITPKGHSVDLILPNQADLVRPGYTSFEDVDHGWIGGNPGKYSIPAAPDDSELVGVLINRPGSDSLHADSIASLLGRRTVIAEAT